MDTLMDKLAQKLNAQEMIRANGEAEAEQMNYLKTQVSEYQGCLDRLMQVCNELGSLENRLGNLSLPQNGASDEAVAEIKSQLETLAQSTDNQLKELSNTTNTQLREFSDTTGKRLDQITEMTDSQFKNLSEKTDSQLKNLSEKTDSQFKTFSEQTNQQLKDMQGELIEKVGAEENLHKEGVRIYKNIQASMVNELEPIDESLKDFKKQILSAVKGVKILAVVGVILSALTLIIQIIKMLGIM